MSSTSGRRKTASPTTKGRPTALGEALLEPCRSGRLVCVNAPGSALCDDKVVHAYVPEMIRFYMGEEPLLESVRSYDLADAEEREKALGRLDELVVKPRGEMGGKGVVIWSDADYDLASAPSRPSSAPRGLRCAGADHPLHAPHAVRRPPPSRVTSTCAPTCWSRTTVPGSCREA